MNSPSEYGVYTARFPFLDSGKGKIRPVVVIARAHSKYGVVAVIPISSKLSLEAVDIAISDIAAAGLVKPSTAQIHRLSTLLQSDLISQLGSLSEVDVDKLKRSMRKFLAL